MRKNTVLKIINPVLLLLFISQTITALFREHLSYKTFALLHKSGGAIFLCLIAIHIILNFNWIRANFFPRR